jgi:two-component system chemotaxis sensor kinase CheA
VAVDRLVETIGTVNIVVLQADGRRFGLVVDGINDTEEIVVKPLGKPLKGLSLFAGATIMGDGRVSLILDVSGIARRAGIVAGMADRLSMGESAAGRKPEEERSAYLLLRHGAAGRVAIPLSHVARLEEIPVAAVESSSDREVVQYRGQIIPLVRLSRALSRGRAARDDGRDPMQLVVYTQGGQSVGLVVDEILDIVEDAARVRSTCGGRGLLGSAVIQQRVTDVLDVPGLIHAVDPELATAGLGVGD